MAYTGLGERTALIKASRQMNINQGAELRQAHKLIMEVSRFQNRADWLISQTIPEKLMERAPHGIRNFLRIIAYVKFVASKSEAYLERTLSSGRRIIGWRDLRPYEEAIARMISMKTAPPTTSMSEFDRLAIQTCHPAWYVKRTVEVFGRSIALKILNRNLFPVSTFVRVNSLRPQDPSLVEELNASRVKGTENVYRLERSLENNIRSRLSSSGQIVIQDLGSITAGLVASPRPGQVVLDVCASPGNKTSHLAAQMENTGSIYSVEVSTTRSYQWKKEMSRTGCAIATLVRADAGKLPFAGEVDVAIVDPPCSNSGVFARNPASKWRVTAARVKELVRLQGEILQSASERVSQGGVLVYCTCSILPEEDEIVVETFLKKNSEFTLSPQAPMLGAAGLRGLTACQRFYSHLHDCNGYFIAKFRRN
jgi:16S rRNA (cytosine967-C5)-methyltransferase